jgi:broad specificity phosphatase PhoE
VADRFTGSTDIPLNEVGQRHARLLGERLARLQPGPGSGNDGIQAVYSSSLARAEQTAQAIARSLALPVSTLSGLQEQDCGLWEGMYRAEIIKQYAKGYADWKQDPVVQAPPAGETGLDVIGRAQTAINEIIEAHADHTVVVVAHKTVNRMLICYWLGLPLRQYRQLVGQDTACLNVIDIYPDHRVSLVKLNDTGHYEIS